jgi:hypothetical protein
MEAGKVVEAGKLVLSLFFAGLGLVSKKQANPAWLFA